MSAAQLGGLGLPQLSGSAAAAPNVSCRSWVDWGCRSSRDQQPQLLMSAAQLGGLGLPQLSGPAAAASNVGCRSWVNWGAAAAEWTKGCRSSQDQLLQLGSPAAATENSRRV